MRRFEDYIGYSWIAVERSISVDAQWKAECLKEMMEKDRCFGEVRVVFDEMNKVWIVGQMLKILEVEVMGGRKDEKKG